MKYTNKTTRFYVYKLIDPNTSLPFYIGKGSGDRINQHERQKDKSYNTTTHKNKLLKNKINKVLRESGYIRYQKHYTTSETVAFKIEMALIKKYGRKNNNTGILCNMTDGGEGVSGCKRTEKWKQKHKDSAHNRCKQIDQYTLEGEYIKTWNNYKDIIKTIPKVDSSALSRCCNNKNKSAGGYRWTWHGVPLQKWIDKPRGPGGRNKGGQYVQYYIGKTVYQYTLEGRLVNVFESTIQAASHINRSPNSIQNCCAGRVKHTNGYYWSYAKSPPKYTKNVFQYNSCGNFVAEFVNVRSAELQTGTPRSQIRNALYNPKTMGGGFYWRKTKTQSIVPHKKKTTGRRVQQYTTQGKLINTFESIRQAKKCTKILGISNCIHGRSKTAGEYVWRAV